MASKKGKKSKGVTMSLQDFAMKVDEGKGAPGPGQSIVYAEKNAQKPMMSNWADEMEDDNSASFFPERIILPSGTRASRGPAYNDEDLPKTPPFTAHLGNLPYDLGEPDIYQFFRDQEVVELKLPRDPVSQKLKGFGYAEFATRDDLRDALELNDTMLRGRKVRVTLGTGQDRRGGDRDMDGMRGDGDRRRRPPAEDEEVNDWRSQMKPQGFEAEPEFRRGPPSGDYGSMPRGGSGGYNNNYNRDRGYGAPRGGRGPPPPSEELDFSRSQMMQGPPPGPPPQHFNTYGGRDNGPRGGGGRGGYQQGRDRDYYDNRSGGGDRDHRYGNGGGYRDNREQNFYRGPPSGPPSSNYAPAPSHSRHHSSDASDAEGGGSGTWRRPPPREHTLSQSSQSSSHNYGPQSSGSAYQPPHHQRSESPPMRRPVSPDGYSRSRDREENNHEDADLPPQKPEPPKERKRLILQPRTVDQVSQDNEIRTSSIFGGAKPVDTHKREMEIEKKLEEMKVEEKPAPEGNGGAERERTGGDRQNRERGGDRDRERTGDRDRGDRDHRGGDRDHRNDRRGERGDRDRGGDRDRRGEYDRSERGGRDRGDRDNRDHREHRNRENRDRERHSSGKDRDDGSDRGGMDRDRGMDRDPYRDHGMKSGDDEWTTVRSHGMKSGDDEWTTVRSHQHTRKKYETKKSLNGGRK